MPDRFHFFLRVLLVVALAPLIVAARPHLMVLPKATQSASIAPESQAQKITSVTTGSRGVVAVVNDSVISDYDLNQRLALFVATSGVHPTEDAIKRIRDEVLRSLVDEMLQLQEAQKNKIAVSKEEVDKALETIAHQNNASLDQINQMLKGAGVDITTLRNQITSEIAWQKLIQDQLAQRVQISDQDVDTALRRLAEGEHQPQYLVSEIFIGVDTPDKEDKAREGANQIAQQLHLGASFAAAARQFSQSPSAASGGDIGWVQPGQLADELDKNLSTMHVGDIVGPIKIAGGYYILLLRDKREPIGTVMPKTQTAQPGLPEGTVPLARILLPMPAKIPKELQERALQVAESIRQSIKSCANLKQLSEQVKGSVYMSLGNMKVDQLSPELRNALANTQSGDVAAPYMSSAGVEIIVRCDPRIEKVVAFQMPTRKEVEDRLFNDQMSLMSRRYLRDLRRDAVVEYR